MPQELTIKKIDLFIEIPDKYLPESLRVGEKRGFLWSDLAAYRDYFDEYIVEEFISQGILAVGSPKVLERLFSTYVYIETAEKLFYLAEKSSHADCADGFVTAYQLHDLSTKDKTETCGCGGHGYHMKKDGDLYILNYVRDWPQVVLNDSAQTEEYSFKASDLEWHFRLYGIKDKITEYLAELSRNFAFFDLEKICTDLNRRLNSFNYLIDTGDIYTGSHFYVQKGNYYETVPEIIRDYDKLVYEQNKKTRGFATAYKEIEVEYVKIDSITVEIQRLFEEKIWATMNKIEASLSDEVLKNYLSRIKYGTLGNFREAIYDTVNLLTQQINSCFTGELVQMYKYTVKPDFNFWKGWDNQDYVFVIPKTKTAFLFGVETSD